VSRVKIKIDVEIFPKFDFLFAHFNNKARQQAEHRNNGVRKIQKFKKN
jgi:hypothetical protein